MASSGLAEWYTENGAFSHLERFGSWDKGLLWMWPINFKLAFAGKGIVAKTIPAQKKAVTSKKAASSSDSDSGNSRNQVVILLC